MAETEKTLAPSSAAKPHRLSVFLVFVLLIVAYSSNFRCIRFGDTAPARVLPFSLLIDHTLYLDRWFNSYVPTIGAENGTYYLSLSRGHRMSAYPIIMPVAITPIYIVPAWLVARHSPPLAANDVVMVALLDVMEKLSASLIAALSGAILFLAFRKIATLHLSLCLALVYGLASSTWSISSQGLWRHGFTELCFAGLLWGLVQETKKNSRAFWCGMALAAAAANSVANGVVVLPFLVYFARLGKREFLRFFAPLAVLGSAVLGYNLYFFGRIMGGYPSVVVQSPQGAHLFRAASVWSGALGLLISPGRGLLIFTPWTLAALWGMARAWKHDDRGWERYLTLGILGVYVEHSLMGTWWSGWSFGPRYLTDVLPLLVFFLIPIWPRIKSSRLLRAATVACLAASLWIQAVGAFYYPRGQWDALPANVDQHPARLWDWEDNPIRRSWQAGPARPELLDEIFLLSNLLKPARPTPGDSPR